MSVMGSIGATAAILPVESSRSGEVQAQRLAPVAGHSLQEVVITGVGVILPNCDSRVHFWQHLSQGESQLCIEPDPSDQLPAAMGRIKDFNCASYAQSIPQNFYNRSHREQQLYLASVLQACKDAELELDALRSDRMGLYDGTSRGSFAFWYDAIRANLEDPEARFDLRDLTLGLPGHAVGLVAAALGIRGPTYTFNGTCAAGGIAIGHAFRELQSGRIDVALGTGHDAALIAPIYQMYRDAQLVSNENTDPSRAIRPFGGSNGNAFGEGAVTVVMETRQHAEARDAQILCEVLGFRYGNGGEHPTDVDFIGQRPAELIGNVLEDAELTPHDVDFVLGHGNGVRVSDISELNYMKRVFGRRTRQVPLISTKPVYGHTFGASSALNVAASALMLHNDFVIPTVGVDEAHVVHGFNHQANQGEARPLSGGLVVAYGIGGQNAVLLLRKAQP